MEDTLFNLPATLRSLRAKHRAKALRERPFSRAYNFFRGHSFAVSGLKLITLPSNMEPTEGSWNTIFLHKRDSGGFHGSGQEGKTKLPRSF